LHLTYEPFKTKSMNMKIASIRFLAAMLFSAIAIVPLQAQTSASAENATNQPVTVTDSAPASNAVAAVGTQTQKKSSESSSVRTDNTGLPHIHFQATEGKNPVVDTVAIVAIFGMPVAIVAIMFYTIHRRNKLVHENLRAMIDKGIPITPELVDSLKGKHSGALNQPLSTGGHPLAKSGRARRLLPGLVLTGVGAALMISGHWFGGPGLIVLFIGIAFLIVWLVERMDRSNNQPPKQ
jgi:uncharacterized membrane protein